MATTISAATIGSWNGGSNNGNRNLGSWNGNLNGND